VGEAHRDIGKVRALDRRITRVLPREAGVSYDGNVTAALRNLDVYVVFLQTEELLARFHDALAVPLGHRPEPDEENDLVNAQLVPKDLRRTKHFVYFHADKDVGKEKLKKDRVVMVHLRYRLRPEGAVPSDMKALRAKGKTVEWAEETISGFGKPVVFVEAQLHLTHWERRRPALDTPALEVGGARLKHCGAEYRGEASVGQINAFRWVEREPGTLDAWLTYSYPLKEKVQNIWRLEEERCGKWLEQLV
jgi:hypothetical protein